MNIDYVGLGSRIRKHRLKLNLTQEQLAERIDISESFLGHIERGSRKLSLETLVKLAQEFRVSTDYLLLDTIKQPLPDYINELISNLEIKDKKKVNTLLNLIKLLSENLSSWVE